MRQLLYIFGFCALLTLGFTACQQEEDALVQLSLEDLQKRDSKKHPKLEYVTTVNNNSVSSSPKMHYSLDDNDLVLEIRFLLESKEVVSVSFIDNLGAVVYEDTDIDISQWKTFNINPAANYPYDFKVYSKTFIIKGKIYKE